MVGEAAERKQGGAQRVHVCKELSQATGHWRSGKGSRPNQQATSLEQRRLRRQSSLAMMAEYLYR